jgi:predicted AlkP superfamily pyrophosphatase or phosphodiesterase
LLIVLDGLRPDYVTPSVMPNLHALGQRGVVFANHHSVFPTVTRVNASSI